jgi:hypothetical protein
MNYILRNCVNDNQVQTHMTWPTRVDALNYVWENFERGVVWVDVNDRPAVVMSLLSERNEVLEVTNPELILDPSKPAYMIRTL